MHLDNEYRNKHEEYITPDVTYDSREINWREVPWDKVIEIRMYVNNNVHIVTNKDLNCKTLMRWRWGGQVAQFDKDGHAIAPKKIKIWCIGWTDGKTCFMKEVDFHTGELIEEKNYPLNEFKKHIHPEVKTW